MLFRDFEFLILHNPRGPRQECSRTMVYNPSGSSPPLNRVPDSPRNQSRQYLQNLKDQTSAVQRTQTQPLHSCLLLNPILHLGRRKGPEHECSAEHWPFVTTKNGCVHERQHSRGSLSELIEKIGDTFTETCWPRVPAELTYIVEIGDGSKLEVKASDESGSDFIEWPIRGFLAAQRSSRDTWQALINQRQDYGNRRNAVVSTVSRGPNEDKRRRWYVVGAHELGQ